jgi:hypothetical protein
MTISLNEWAASVEGRYKDVDGSWGGQCWDLVQDYLWKCVQAGLALHTRPAAHAGWALGVWEVALGSSAQGKQLRAALDPRTGDERAQPGDIIVWGLTPGLYPASHIAVVLEDRGTHVWAMSQNSSKARPDLPGYSNQASGPAIRQLLPKTGIAGYLRPRNMAKAAAPVPTAPRLQNRTITANGTKVRTGPGTGYAEAPGYAGGLPAGTVIAVQGYVAGQAVTPGNDAWFKTKSGYYVWANLAGNSLAGLPRL